MGKVYRTFFRFCFFAMVFALYSLMIFIDQKCAAWSNDPNVNTPICTASDHQGNPSIISDGSGGAIITWDDDRFGYTDIYAQRVDKDGSIQWTLDGIPICTAGYYDQQNPSIVSDGSGGAIIIWLDERPISSVDIYAQRVNRDGAIQWTIDGIPICTAGSDQQNPSIVSDGSGGAIITWTDWRSSTKNVYAQRVNSSGDIQWTVDGIPICTANGEQRYPSIVSDGSGGAIIAWTDWRNATTSDIYAQRVNSNGAIQWTLDGIPICTKNGDQEKPAIASDGSGGAIITWMDKRNVTTYTDIYAQRVNSSGAIQWNVDGIPICTANFEQGYPSIVIDGSGGAIITWWDLRSYLYSVYAQRVNSNGVIQWAVDGTIIRTGTKIDVGYPSITSDGFGGAIITWTVSGMLWPDIYAQRVNSSGAIQWTLDGIPICRADGPQDKESIISDGFGGAIIAWEDHRSIDRDIYAQRIDRNGYLGVAPCPECNIHPVVLENVRFETGTDCECSDPTCITIGSGVTIESGAKIFFKAPKITVKSGARFQNGSEVIMKQQ